MNVMLVEERDIFRAGLQALLETANDVHVVGAAVNARQAIDVFPSGCVDLVYISTELPDCDGIGLTQRLQELRPGLSVALILSSLEGDLANRALEAQVIGYLTRSATREELLQSVQAISSGSSYIQPEIASSVLSVLRTRETLAPVGMGKALSIREREVLQLAVRGKRNQEIAKRLELSTSTVKTHVRALYRKLEVTDRTQLVLKAIQNRLITPDGND